MNYHADGGGFGTCAAAWWTFMFTLGGHKLTLFSPMNNYCSGIVHDMFPLVGVAITLYLALTIFAALTVAKSRVRRTKPVSLPNWMWNS